VPDLSILQGEMGKETRTGHLFCNLPPFCRLDRAAKSAFLVHRALLEYPISSPNALITKTGRTAATVNKSLAHLARLGIVRELTARKRNRLFSYHQYVEIINKGTELPE
jgi:hypothetical protein